MLIREIKEGLNKYSLIKILKDANMLTLTKIICQYNLDQNLAKIFLDLWKFLHKNARDI